MGQEEALKELASLLPETHNTVNTVWEVYYDGQVFEHTIREETERRLSEQVFRISRQ
jgi:hypothetical protein